MADNTVVINPSAISGGPGDTIATDDIGGVKFQRIKLVHGDDGVNDGDVSSTNPLPTSQGNRISTTSFNSRDAATLLASATFQGVGEDVSSYGRVGVSISSDNATDGVLTMEVSRDNVNWGGPTRTWSDTRFASPHMWNIVEKYFRVKYVNGTTEATNLAIQVQYSNNANTLLGHQLDETLLDETEALAVRSVTVGQDPNGVYKNEGVSGVDDGNSSSTNLTTATSLVFTGAWQDISNYSGTTVLVDGTSSGTVSGTLQQQFSHDGVTVHRSINTATSDVTNTLPRTLGVVAQYFRVIYTSDGDLTSFDLQTMFHTSQIGIVSRMDQIIQGTEDVTLVRDPTHFDLDAARKHIAGQRSFFFFGFNDDVGTSWEDIHPNGGDINWLQAATKVEILSSDAADNGTSPGLGVQSVEIHGLSATGEDQDEVILTNGTSAVESSLTYIRVNKMHSETCGTYGGSHQGNITCRVTGGGATLSLMTGEEGAVDTAVVYGSGEAGNGYWSCPLGKVMYLTRLEVIPNVGTNKTVDIALYEREDILDVTTPFAPRRVLWQESGVDTTVEHEFKSHIKIKALADIWFRAKASATSKIEVAVDFYLVDADSEGA